MLTKNELATKIARYIDCEKSGSCGVFAVWLTRVLVRHGHEDFRIVFGGVKDLRCVVYKFPAHQHVWLEWDGEICDPTFVQFEHPASYMTKRKYLTPQQFLEHKNFCLNDPRTKPWMKRHLLNFK